ncbi:unnamed protein product [Closterium sp. Yama58-4]|nr:unnamed protein product [Closterium sp. Yama58-4]
MASSAFETYWKVLTDNFTDFQLATIGSFLIHECVFFMSGLPYLILENLNVRKYKLQKRSNPASSQIKCVLKLLMYHCLVNLPLIMASYPVFKYMGFRSTLPLPHWSTIVTQIVSYFFIEDFVFYWGHRALHSKWLYQNVHCVHHEYATPFGLTSEYAHPAEILFLGFATILGPALTGPHLLTLWLWMSLRVLETVEAHSGFEFPWSPSRFIPLYGGAEYHDYHHRCVYTDSGNYSSTFIYMDWIFGTDKNYRRMKALKAGTAKDEAPTTNAGGSPADAAMTGPLPSPANRTRFKTPEGRYLLSHEKVHPAGLIQYTHQRNPTKITLAHLEDRPPPLPPPSPSPVATSAGSRFAKNFLGAGSGTRGLPFGGGNGRQSAAAPAASGASAGTGTAGGSNGAVGGAGGAGGAGEKEKAGGEGEGSYVIFNVGESLFVADANSTDKEPLKALQFMGASGLCHAFDGAVASRDAQGTAGRDTHDLLIATTAGDSRDGLFVTAHADWNVYVFDKHRDGTTEPGFPPIKDAHAFSTAHARSNKSNPLARWHISPSAINALAFSPSGSHMATVSRDGYLRVFDWEREALEGGCKSYYGAFLCCAFSSDGRLVAAGGEDDLVALWDRHSHAVLAWCEGHCSWVTAVAFDPFLSITPPPPSTIASPPSTTAATSSATPSSASPIPTSSATTGSGAGVGAAVASGGAEGSYRLGSVGQDTQLLLWDIALDDVVLPLRLHPHHQSAAATSASHPHDEEQQRCWCRLLPAKTCQEYRQ